MYKILGKTSILVIHGPSWQRLALLYLLLGLASCAAARTQPAYKLYPGPALPAEDITIVQLGDAWQVRIDENQATAADWSEVQVLPGSHAIEWHNTFGVSVLVSPSGYASGSESAVVELEAGHIYRLRNARTYGHGFQMFFWIEDVVSGEVIAGEKKR